MKSVEPIRKVLKEFEGCDFKVGGAVYVGCDGEIGGAGLLVGLKDDILVCEGIQCGCLSSTTYVAQALT